MSGSKTARRVLLKKVDVFTKNVLGETSEQATVALVVENRLVFGQVPVAPIEDGALQAIALATLQALLKAMPKGAKFVLKKVLKLNPKFLDEFLVVTIIDASYDDLELNLTGASIVRQEKLMWGTANAVLDATNRFTTFLLEVEKPEDDDEDELDD